MAKIHSMSIAEFMNRDSQVKRVSTIKTSAPFVVGAGTLLSPVSAFAAGPGDFVKDKTMDLIMSAMDPIIAVLQSIAYPAGVIGLTWAGIMMMLNQRSGSVAAIQAVGMGYLMIQAAPWFMDMLKMIVSGVS